jgi:lipopolysaccharide/colanic/teichoic acid biosynthesis glycosyltransferase
VCKFACHPRMGGWHPDCFASVRMDQPPIAAVAQVAYVAPRVGRVLRRLRRLAVRLTLRTRALGPTLRRALDVLVTGLGLLCLSPLFALVALAIRVDTKGPIFFAQERLAEHGRRFWMYKFRTMVVDADALKDQLSKQCAQATDGVRFKMVRDPRVTRVGAVLRKFSIDELPQLFNVFRGDMTLIGPRPAVWREVARYDNRALRRLEVRPGLTCLWQVSGRSDLSFQQQIELDLEYVDTTRPLDELRIVMQTIPAVLTGRGAY